MEKEIKNKKAQSGHIEMILSFVIFAGFVLVIFVFLNPVTQERISYTALDSVQSNIFKNLSLSYSSSSISLAEGLVIPNCFFVNNIINSTSNLIVRDSMGAVKLVKVDSERIYIDSAAGRFYKLYYSEAFNSNRISSVDLCQPILAGAYAFGILSKDSSILYENFVDFNKSYMSNYNLLKSQLGLKNDFVYIIYDTNKTVLYQDSLLKHKIKGINTLSRDIPLRAITKNAEFVDLIFHLEVW